MRWHVKSRERCCVPIVTVAHQSTFSVCKVTVWTCGCVVRSLFRTDDEVEICLDLRPGAHIVQVLGVCADAPDGKLRIVMEHCSLGTLRKFVADKATESKVRGYMRRGWFDIGTQRLGVSIIFPS